MDIADSGGRTFTYTYKNGTKENYDQEGRLSSLKNSRGASLEFTYEAGSRSPLWGLLPANLDQNTSLIVAYDYRISRIEEKDASGSYTNTWVLFHYDGQTGRLTDLVDNQGRTVTYTHDTIGNLTSDAGPSRTTTYEYTDSAHRHYLTGADLGQGRYENTYDTHGRVTRQTYAGGVIDFNYITPYQKTMISTTVKDGSGNVLNTRTRTVEFNAAGQIAKETDTYGHVVAYDRDGNMNITREEFWENTGSVSTPNLVLRSAVDFTYDAKNNMLTRTDAAGTVTYTYHPTFNKLTSVTSQSVVNTEQNRTITYAYDDTTGTLQSKTETGLLGNGSRYTYATTYGYDGNGKLTSIDGPRTDVSDVTTFTYTSSGFLASMTQPIIGTTTYSNQDALGNPQTITDPNGNSATYTYDAIGRVTSVKAPGDTNSTQIAYAPNTCVACEARYKIDHITLPEGNTIWYTYDTFGNTITIKDSLNNTINYTYDSQDNRLTEQIKDASGALQKSLSYQYDALNRLAEIVNPDSTYAQYGYDYRGNRASFRNPNGNTTTYQYDVLNRLTATIQPGSVTTGYAYDTMSHLVRVTDANNNATQYKLDDKGRVYQTISPDTGTTTYSYDPAGNMISKTDAKGIMIAYQYDATNRLTQVSSPAGSGLSAYSVVYTYGTASNHCPNGVGRLCIMEDASGSTSYEYTTKGQVSRETKTINSIQYVTQYTYDQNGNTKTVTYPSGKVITYNYTNNRVTSVLNGTTTIATNISYKPFGGLTAITYGNGLVGSVGYDNQYRTASITAGAVINLTYADDANGNITSITNNLDQTKSRTFGYDALDRLASATASGIWGSLSWTYDGVGNRLAENGNAYTYYTNSNRLNTANGISYGYDNDGNTTTQGARLYTYNQNQRLVQVVDGAMTANYTYNGNGQRVKKSVNGVITVFHYDLRGQLIAVSDSAGTITAEYVYLNGQPLAKIDSSGVNFIHTDNIGAPAVVTDATGAKVWEIVAKPFGDGATIIGTATLNLRNIGEYLDAETGLHYNYFRYRNLATGTYNEADRIGLRGGINPYSWVGNNPIMLMDPLGLCWVYEESTGDIYYSTGGKMYYQGTGYSGSLSGKGLDDPAMQDVQDVGPIPIGTYDIGTYQTNWIHNGTKELPNSMRLTPADSETSDYLRNIDRGGFLIHGGSFDTYDSSTGCIVASPDLRYVIGNSGITTLRVEP